MSDSEGLPRGIDSIPSPSLCIDSGIVARNLAHLLEMVGGNASLVRPHIKTHKCGEILQRQLAAGIRQIKCATIAEAELAAQSGVPDILIAYPLAGHNVLRFFQLGKAYPEASFSALVDSATGLAHFSAHAESCQRNATLLLDLDCGMHRTGIPAGEEAIRLIETILEHPLLSWGGIHAYDGHIHQPDLSEREEAFNRAIEIVHHFVASLEESGISVPLIVSGGSPTFAMHAAVAAASELPWQCSPGTPLLWDAGYGSNHPDLEFEPAAFLLTRVVSHPGEGRICVDLGTKAVSAENPIQNRVRFPAIKDATFVSQSEEHLVITVDDPARYPVGTSFLAVPYHVCPSVALYEEAYIIEDGQIDKSTWAISRGRKLTL